MLFFTNYLDKKIGGVEQLIINVAIELDRRNEICKMYSSTCSYSYLMLKKMNINFVHIDSDIVPLNQLSRYISPDDVVVLTHMYNFSLLINLSDVNCKVLFYSVHPETFKFNSRFLNTFYPMVKLKKDFLTFMLEKQSLYFMCGETSQEVVKTGICIQSVKYIPIPTILYSKRKKHFSVDSPLTITYLGRGNADWKIFPILKILTDLDSISVNVNLEFHILTCSKELIMQMISKYLPHNKVTIKYVIGLNTIDLENYLLLHSDLHIAMGTSALEGAKLAIPTVLIDASYNIFPTNYEYRWLYETSDYILGRIIDSSTIPLAIGTTLKEKVDSILEEKSWLKISNRTYEYVMKNHSIENFVSLLLSAADRTNLYIEDCANLKYMKYINRYQTIKHKILDLFSNEK